MKDSTKITIGIGAALALLVLTSSSAPAKPTGRGGKGEGAPGHGAGTSKVPVRAGVGEKGFGGAEKGYPIIISAEEAAARDAARAESHGVYPIGSVHIGSVHIGSVVRAVKVGDVSRPTSAAPDTLTPEYVANQYAAKIRQMGITPNVKASRTGYVVSFRVKPEQNNAVDALTAEFNKMYLPNWIPVRAYNAKWVDFHIASADELRRLQS